MDLEAQIHHVDSTTTDTSPTTSNIQSCGEASQNFTGTDEGNSTFVASSSGTVTCPIFEANPDRI
jgi:hypothetical protein